LDKFTEPVLPFQLKAESSVPDHQIKIAETEKKISDLVSMLENLLPPKLKNFPSKLQFVLGKPFPRSSMFAGKARSLS